MLLAGIWQCLCETPLLPSRLSLSQLVGDVTTLVRSMLLPNHLFFFFFLSVVVSPDAGGVYRAKKFREGLAHRYGLDAGLAMIIKQRAKANEVRNK